MQGGKFSIQVRMPPSMLAAIKAMAAARNDTVSETLRALIEAGLKAYGRSKSSV